MGLQQDIKAAKAWVELTLNDSKFSRGLARAENELRAFANRMTSIGMSGFGISAAALAPIGLAVRQFAKLDDTLRLVRAVASATRVEFEALSKKARYIGRTTSFTPQEAADAMATLGRAGFNPKQVDLMISHVMNLSRATQTNIATSAEITGNTLRQFGMSAEETVRVVDVLAAAANSSSQTLEDIAVSFKYAAPVAKEFGMEIEEAAYYVGILANQGLRGEMAGTSLRNILARLGGSNVRKQFEEVLGIPLHMADGQIKGMKQIFDEANAEMERLGWDAYKRQDWLHKTFGLRSMAGGAKLTSVGEQYTYLLKILENSAGTAERTAKQMDEGIGGAIRITLSAIEELGNVIAEAVSGKLRDLGLWIQGVADKLVILFTYNKDVVWQYTKWFGIIAAGSVALIAFGAVLRSVGAIVGLFALTFKGLLPLYAGFAIVLKGAMARVAGFTASMLLARGASIGFAQAAGTATASLLPLMGVLGAIGLAVGGAYLIFKKLTAQDLSFRALEDARQYKAGFGEDEKMLTRLVEIKRLHSKTNEELEEARNIISDLQSKYGDLGLSVNSVTREVEGLVDETKKLEEFRLKQSKGLYRKNEDAIKEQEKNMMVLALKWAWVAGNYNPEIESFKVDVTEMVRSYGEGVFLREDWKRLYEKTYGESIEKKDYRDPWQFYMPATDWGSLDHPISFQGLGGKFYIIPYKAGTQRDKSAQKLSGIAKKYQEADQTLFDLRGEQRVLAYQKTPFTKGDLQSVTYTFPTEGYQEKIKPESKNEFLANLVKRGGAAPTAKEFDAWRWNLINAMGAVESDKAGNAALLEQAELMLERAYPQIFTKQGGFVKTDNLRMGVFGTAGQFGQTRIGGSNYTSVEAFQSDVEQFRAYLMEHLDEGSEVEQQHRRVMLRRLQEFNDAYSQAIMSGTSLRFDFSAWSDLASYEATSIIKNQLKQMREQRDEAIKKVFGSYEEIEEGGRTAFKVIVGFDEEGEKKYYKDGQALSRAEMEAVLGEMAKPVEQAYQEQSKQLSLIGNVLTAQAGADLYSRESEMLRKEARDANKYLADILRIIEKDYQRRKEDLFERYGASNEYTKSARELQDDRKEALQAVDDAVKTAKESSLEFINGLPLEEWRTQEYKNINTAFDDLEGRLEFKYGLAPFDEKFNRNPRTDEEFLYREKYGLTYYDAVNTQLQMQIGDLVAERGLYQQAGKDQFVKETDAKIARIQERQLKNAYDKATNVWDNYANIFNRSKGVAEQLRQEIDAQKQTLERNRGWLTEEQINQAEAYIQQLIWSYGQVMDRYATSKFGLEDSERTIRAYERVEKLNNVSQKSLLNIERSFSSAGTFDAYSASGVATPTFVTELKEQTSLLGSIDNLLARMAQGEFI